MKICQYIIFVKIIVHLTDTELVKDEPQDKEKIIMLWVLQQFIAL